MSYGIHPDSLAIACAQGTANNSGHPHGSLAWRIAYRDAYWTQNDRPGADDNQQRSLEHYVGRYDKGLAEDMDIPLEEVLKMFASSRGGEVDRGE